MSASSSAASTAGTARAPLSARARRLDAVGVASCSPASRRSRPSAAGGLVYRIQFDVHGVAVQLALEFFGGALDDDPAVVDDREPVSQLVGLLQIVRGEQHGHLLCRRQPLDLAPHVGAGLGIEAGGRFVQEQHARAVHQADRDVELAGHPTGVGLGEPVGIVGQTEAVQQLAVRAIAPPCGTCPGSARLAPGSPAPWPSDRWTTSATPARSAAGRRPDGAVRRSRRAWPARNQGARGW